jgi:hypothetical protein
MSQETTSDIYKWLTPIITLIVGSISGVLLEKFKNRTVFLKKRVNIQLIASSSNSPDWGKINILHDGQTSNSLYAATIEIINDSSVDLDELVAEFSVNSPAFIVRDSGALTDNDVSKQLLWEANYSRQFLNVQKLNDERLLNKETQEDKLLDNQTDFITHNRQYVVPIFNRGSKVVFNVLIDCFQDIPQVNVAIFELGVKLITQQDADTEKKNRQAIVNIIAAILFIISAFPTINYASNISWGVWVMVINSLAVYIVAWPLYFTFIFLKRYFT